MSSNSPVNLTRAHVVFRFESAIVPRWGASTICFSNVYVSRRPQNNDPTNPKPGSGSSPAERSIAAPSPVAFLSASLSPETYFTPPAADNDNYTMFDVNIEEVEVTLSFMRWLDGKGLVKDAKVKGVRGVVGELADIPVALKRSSLTRRPTVRVVGY